MWIGESDVGDGEPTRVPKRNMDWPYCIIDGACANSPKCTDCRRVKDSDGMGWSRCRQKAWK